MADSTYPGVVGATAANPPPVYQHIPGRDKDEAQVPRDSEIAWRDDIAEAQAAFRARRQARYKRLLLGGAATIVLLAPVAMLGWLKPHWRHGCHHHHGPNEGEVGESLADVPFGQLPVWLQSLQGPGNHHSHHHHHQQQQQQQLDWWKGDGDDDGDKKKWTPFHGNGKFYVDPEEFGQLDLVVKAHGTWSWVTIRHGKPGDDHPGHPKHPHPPPPGHPGHPHPHPPPPGHPGHPHPPPHGDDYSPTEPETPAFLHKLNERDDDDDDDAHKGKIRIDFRAYLPDDKLQDAIRVVEERSDDGRYLWKLVGGDKHFGGRHGHGHRKHPKKIFVKLHVHIPDTIESLDALQVGVIAGAVHARSLKSVQLGKFKAAAYYGRIHVGEINAVTTVEVATVYGPAVLHHAIADSIKAASVHGLVHVTHIATRQLLHTATVAGEVVVHHVEAPHLDARSVTGQLTVAQTKAGRLTTRTVSGAQHLDAHVHGSFGARSVSGSVHANVSVEKSEDDMSEWVMVDNTASLSADMAAFVADEKEGEAILLLGDDDDDDDDDDDQGGSDGQRVVLAARSGSGDVHLHVVGPFEGRFRTGSLTGKIQVKGPRVHIESDKRTWKTGYVGEDGQDDDSPLAVARTLSGEIRLQFD